MRLSFLIILVCSCSNAQSEDLEQNTGNYVDKQIQLYNCPDQVGKNVLIDLGANCGNSFLELVEQYGEFDKYYLWELNPMLIEQLKKMARENQKVTLIPYGAWYEHTTMQLDIKGQNQDVCDPTKSFWEDTTIVQTSENQTRGDNYHSTVQAETRDFVAWYKQTFCLQDKVTLKIDIEKAEYAVLGNMYINGLICHPYRLLVEFHEPGEPLKVNQHIISKAADEDQKNKCFAAGFISALEYIVQFCDDEPALVRWD